MRFEWRQLVQRLADANVPLPSDLFSTEFTEAADPTIRRHLNSLNTPETLPVVMKRPAAVVKQICKAWPRRALVLAWVSLERMWPDSLFRKTVFSSGRG